jgi:SAM-dependent methyltransferase
MPIFSEFKQLYDYNLRYTERIATHDCLNVFQKTFRDLKLAGFQSLSGKKVLDLGCGQRYPFALQCAAKGAKVTALDINYVKPDILILYFFRCLKHNGLKRAIKSFLRKMLFDKHYYQVLEECANGPIFSFLPKINFVATDLGKLNYSLPSQMFDLIASNAVLEHVSDVAGFAIEVKRMLRPEGYFYGFIHNFYSISGGHCLEWAFPDDTKSKKIPPWDHLRANKYPTHVYLNQYKPEQYRNAFAEHLEIKLFEGRDINHDHGGKEGVQFLTGQVAKELNKYPRDLLLTRSYCIICRKNL